MSSYTTIIHRQALDPTAYHAINAVVPGQIEAQGDYHCLRHDTVLAAGEREILRQQLSCDINTLPVGFDPAAARLLMTDMDSTLITIECVDEIADYIGAKSQVAAITEAAMRGEIDFTTSLTRRVSLLQGVPLADLQDVYDHRLRLNPGAEALLAGLKAGGIKVALVSGGFTFFTERLKTRLGLDFTLANELEIEHGLLTGRVLGNIVDANSKARFLEQLCQQLGIQPAQAIAVGDGANDLPMMKLAGLSVAYHAKPAVSTQAATGIDYGGLDSILSLLDCRGK